MPTKIDLWEIKPIENEIILNLVKNRGEMPQRIFIGS